MVAGAGAGGGEVLNTDSPPSSSTNEGSGDGSFARGPGEGMISLLSPFGTTELSYLWSSTSLSIGSLTSSSSIIEGASAFGEGTK